MRQIGLLGLAVLVVATLAMGGCADDKNRMATLESDNAAKARELQLLTVERDQLKADCDAKAAENARLRAALDKQPPVINKPEVATTEPAAPAGWEKGLHSDKISVGTDVLFPPGQDTLTAGGKQALDKVVADIRTHYAGMPVRVYGHTDADPIVKTKDKWDDNLDLSLARAAAVSRYLMSKGVKSDLVETIGMSQWHPAADNRTPVGKAKNRRVEIVVIKGS